MTQTEPLSKLIDSEKSLSHRSPSSLSASRAFASCVAATLQRRHFQNEVRYHHQLHHKRRNGGVWPILCRFLIVSLISFLFPGRRRLSQNLRNNESRVIVCSSARISETTTKRSEDGESQVVFAIICSTTLCTCVASLYKHINPSLGNFLLTERRRQRRGKLAATALVQNDKRVKDSIVGCCTRQIEEETDGPFISPSLVSWAAVAAILFLFFFHFHFRNSFVIWKLLFQRQPLMLIRE